MEKNISYVYQANKFATLLILNALLLSTFCGVGAIISFFINKTIAIALFIAVFLLIVIAVFADIALTSLNDKIEEHERRETIKNFYNENHEDIVEQHNRMRQIHLQQEMPHQSTEHLCSEENNRLFTDSTDQCLFNDSMNQYQNDFVTQWAANESLRSVTPFEMGGYNMF